MLTSSFLLLSVQNTCFTKTNLTDLFLNQTLLSSALNIQEGESVRVTRFSVATLSRVKTRSTFQPRSVNNGLDVCFEDRSRNQSRFSTNRLLFTTNTYLYRCHDLSPQSSFPFCFITKLNVTLSVLWVFVSVRVKSVKFDSDHKNPHHVWLKA